ncbi:lecithin retinol acyltransferase family protein [Pseudomonas sp. C1C7]|uniref:lecithin retinol acyltransferase family protein n=1 Tax=Pseudomonas sp. C1C7 TaxID=2735272 RepID=UPI003557C6EA
MKSLLNIEQSLLQVPVGSHLITARKFYIHHGIYLGAGRVAHYAGYSGSFTPGPIEVTDLEHFANGRAVWVLDEQGEYCGEEIVRRAYSRVGERHYRIFSNNCEHFCNWCTRGKSHSTQVELLLNSPRGFFSMMSGLEDGFTA